MRPSQTRRAAAAILLGLLAIAPQARAIDESDLPETLRSGYVAPVNGPTDSETYAHGRLGLLRPGYGRASLYVAYRLMQLPPGAVAAESHERLGDAFIGRTYRPESSGPGEIDAWLQARSAFEPTPPPSQPDFFRTSKTTIPGKGGQAGFTLTSTEGNCGPDAFVFATNTLRGMGPGKPISGAEVREWIAGQDAVFARCTWVPGSGPAPALPGGLPVGASSRLKALRAYQHASALFYSEDFEAARHEFDAIAATPGHPMRAWAALGAMRSIVRPATDDKDWQAAFNDAYMKQGLRDEALHAALASARERHGALAEAAMKDVLARAKAIDADPAFAEVRAPSTYTVRRALTQLSPATVVYWAMGALDHVDQNPYAGSVLDLWTRYYPRALPDRPDDATLSLLRGKHAFYDWITSVQACGDAVRAPDEATCRAEHAHALAQWLDTKRSDWLLATLMTARQPSAADLPAADAAEAVSRDRPEWASLQFYAARVLRALGRANDALRLLDRIAAAPELQWHDDKLVDAEQRALGRAPRPEADARPTQVSERQIRAVYDRLAAQPRPTEYHVRHILVDSQEKAQQALERLHRGESFDQVARDIPSLDPASAAKGGELGWNEAATFDPDFSKAMVALAPRGLSTAPVKSRFGWHVIEVVDTRQKAFPSYERAHDRIAEALRRKAAAH